MEKRIRHTPLGAFIIGVFLFGNAVKVVRGGAFRQAVEEVPEKDWTPFYREVNGKLVETGKQWA